MTKQRIETEATLLARILESCYRHVALAWEQSRLPVQCRRVLQAHSARAKRIGMKVPELTQAIIDDGRFELLINPTGSRYLMPGWAWAELSLDQRAVLAERLRSNKLYKKKEQSELGRIKVAGDGESTVKYFVPSPMEAFLKK